MVELPVKMFVQGILKEAKDSVRAMSCLSSHSKIRVLESMAESLLSQSSEIVEANERDLERIPKDLNQQAYRAMVEKVRISEETVERMTAGLLTLARLPDPIGEVSQAWLTSEGMQVQRVRSPLGVIAIISDMGPLITVSSFGMCVKTSNVCVFRGGGEWLVTNAVIVDCLKKVADAHGLPLGGLSFLDRPSPEAALELVRHPQLVNAVIPRGKSGLRKGILDQAKVPVIGYDGGICHTYVDQDVDLPMAQTIVVNGKVQEPLAANALDTLLVHQATSRHLLPGLIRRLLQEYRVALKGCPITVSMLGMQEMTGHLGIQPATEADWGNKYQSLTLNIKVVKDSQEALDHIAKFAPGHTDTIVTRNYDLAMRFTREVDSSGVMVNASTRLNECEAFGLGPDLGSNSPHVHHRGPIGIVDLTLEKFVVMGSGQFKQPHPVPQAYQDAMMLSSKF
ncbi:MAG: glutamate-5-semialdehyde dehydrogenase [Nitrospirales bacterium]|nr:glutamate-5-semialdehyde dehydrogenase [Nitrospirales bacterium]